MDIRALHQPDLEIAPAERFWRGVIGRYAGDVAEVGGADGPVQTFRSPPTG